MCHSLFCIHNGPIRLNHLENRKQSRFHLGNSYKLIYIYFNFMSFCILYQSHNFLPLIYIYIVHFIYNVNYFKLAFDELLNFFLISYFVFYVQNNTFSTLLLLCFLFYARLIISEFLKIYFTHSIQYVIYINYFKLCI